MTTLRGSGTPVIVVGASAGGIEPLGTIVGTLPADFAASILVVVHGPPTGHRALPSILSRNGPIPATHPADGERIEAGRIYVGVPDRHLIVQDGVMRLTRGPRVNRSRPAIDPLFRSAAITHGPDVIGVVLSGSLDDGTAGLAAVKRHGGVTVVQDPEDAAFAGMPKSAAQIEPDHILPARHIGQALVRIVASMADQPPRKRRALRPHLPDDWDPDLGEIPTVDEATDPEGSISPFGCPDCGGVLWETEGDGITLYECRVGHAYTARNLLLSQADEVESGLWQAFRALEEQATLAARLEEASRAEGKPRAAKRFAAQEATARSQARSIRKLISAMPERQDTDMVQVEEPERQVAREA